MAKKKSTFDINKPIKTVEDITRFFDYLLLKEKVNFHPDTPFEEYVQTFSSGAVPTIEDYMRIAKKSKTIKKLSGITNGTDNKADKEFTFITGGGDKARLYKEKETGKFSLDNAGEITSQVPLFEGFGLDEFAMYVNVDLEPSFTPEKAAILNKRMEEAFAVPEIAYYYEVAKKSKTIKELSEVQKDDNEGPVTDHFTFKDADGRSDLLYFDTDSKTITLQQGADGEVDDISITGFAKYVDVNPKDVASDIYEIAFNETNRLIFKGKMGKDVKAEGGHIGFKNLAKKAQHFYEQKGVDKAEAKEIGLRVAGAVKKRMEQHYAKGGNLPETAMVKTVTDNENYTIRHISMGGEVKWYDVIDKSTGLVSAFSQDLQKIKNFATTQMKQGGELSEAGMNPKHKRAMQLKKINAFLNQFPDNATHWKQATDELPELHNALAKLFPNYKGNVWQDNGGEMPRIIRASPGERNKYHKKQIRLLLSKINDHGLNEFYEDHKEWFNRFNNGGGIPKTTYKSYDKHGTLIKTEDWTNKWQVHTVNLLKDIIANLKDDGVGIVKHPLNIFATILNDVAERAAKINDPELNALMCRLALYNVCDPTSKVYDNRTVKKNYAGADKKAKGGELGDETPSEKMFIVENKGNILLVTENDIRSNWDLEENDDKSFHGTLNTFLKKCVALSQFYSKNRDEKLNCINTGSKNVGYVYDNEILYEFLLEEFQPNKNYTDWAQELGVFDNRSMAFEWLKNELEIENKTHGILNKGGGLGDEEENKNNIDWRSLYYKLTDSISGMGIELEQKSHHVLTGKQQKELSAIVANLQMGADDFKEFLDTQIGKWD